MRMVREVVYVGCRSDLEEQEHWLGSQERKEGLGVDGCLKRVDIEVLLQNVS